MELNHKTLCSIETALALMITIMGGLMTMLGIYSVASHQLTIEAGSNMAFFGALFMWVGIAMTIISVSNGNKWVCMTAIAIVATACYLIIPVIY